jgi:hypothetical protein
VLDDSRGRRRLARLPHGGKGFRRLRGEGFWNETPPLHFLGRKEVAQLLREGPAQSASLRALLNLPDGPLGPHGVRYVELALARVALDPVHLGPDELDDVVADEPVYGDPRPLGEGYFDGNRLGPDFLAVLPNVLLALEDLRLLGPELGLVATGVLPSAERRRAKFRDARPDCLDVPAATVLPPLRVIHRDDVHRALERIELPRLAVAQRHDDRVRRLRAWIDGLRQRLPCRLRHADVSEGLLDGVVPR